jgi:hypothetical protein
MRSGSVDLARGRRPLARDASEASSDLRRGSHQVVRGRSSTTTPQRATSGEFDCEGSLMPTCFSEGGACSTASAGMLKLQTLAVPGAGIHGQAFAGAVVAAVDEPTETHPRTPSPAYARPVGAGLIRVPGNGTLAHPRSVRPVTSRARRGPKSSSLLAVEIPPCLRGSRKDCAERCPHSSSRASNRPAADLARSTMGWHRDAEIATVASLRLVQGQDPLTMRGVVGCGAAQLPGFYVLSRPRSGSDDTVSVTESVVPERAGADPARSELPGSKECQATARSDGPGGLA